mmetsp:Transcript_2329/g.6780  ORF Transcript_2329/g.6780 Transcript_2329/m.6780 type:complete len:131 (-) Transcript_2329:399-791(-)
MEPQYQQQYQQPPVAMPQQELQMQHVVPPPINPAALDVIDSVPGRIGSAILRASDGALLHRPEGGTSPVSDHDLSILYKMLREVGEVVPDGEGMKRLEISFQGGIRYTLVLASDGLDGVVYVIKRRANEQ